MLSKWSPPTHGLPTLSLPILSPGLSDFAWVADDRLSCTVSSNFCDIWTLGPQNESDYALGEAVHILVEGLCDLIVACQGRVSVFQKDGPDDWVTELDLGVEALIRRWVQTFRPQDRWVGEESVPDPFDWALTTWFVDPVDGTRNLIDGDPNVTVHVGVLRRGQPILSVVGEPFFKIVHTKTFRDLAPSEPREQWIEMDQPITAIATEFRSERGPESDLATRLGKRFGLPIQRTRSIGKSVLSLQDSCRIFYKPKAKAWDVIAPLALLHFNPLYDITVTFRDAGAIETRPLFGFDQPFGRHLGECLRNDARIGLITVVPADRVAIRKQMIAEVLACTFPFC